MYCIVANKCRPRIQAKNQRPHATYKPVAFRSLSFVEDAARSFSLSLVHVCMYRRVRAAFNDIDDDDKDSADALETGMSL